MPLLSVIIPTHKRPRQLPRAIASVTETHAGFDYEILVIPNGEDDSWQAVAQQHRHDPHISWHYLAVGNASAARNHGISRAGGKYLRFLDDDDHLLPASADQLRLTEREDLDACSAPLENTSPDGYRRHAIALPPGLDMVAAAIYSARVSLTQGSVFRTSFVQGIPWREDVVLYDDYLWMLDLAASTEAKWTQTSAPVCAYVQHNGHRLSRVRRSGDNSRVLVGALLNLYDRLQEDDRLTPARSAAIAAALLTHAHSAFPASPFFLSTAIRQAIAIDPSVRPLHPMFDAQPRLAKHLLALEWIMLPPRYLTRGYRRATWSLGSLLERPDR